jgi:hypothetical protein
VKKAPESGAFYQVLGPMQAKSMLGARMEQTRNHDVPAATERNGARGLVARGLWRDFGSSRQPLRRQNTPNNPIGSCASCTAPAPIAGA